MICWDFTQRQQNNVFQDWWCSRCFSSRKRITETTQCTFEVPTKDYLEEKNSHWTCRVSDKWFLNIKKQEIYIYFICCKKSKEFCRECYRLKALKIITPKIIKVSSPDTVKSYPEELKEKYCNHKETLSPSGLPVIQRV